MVSVRKVWSISSPTPDRCRLRRLGAHRVQQVGDDAVRIVDLVLDDPQVFPGGFIRIRQHGLQEVDRVVHHRQRIAQFVADTAGHLPQQGQFFLAHQILLGIQQLLGPLQNLCFEFLVQTTDLSSAFFRSVTSWKIATSERMSSKHHGGSADIGKKYRAVLALHR